MLVGGDYLLLEIKVGVRGPDDFTLLCDTELRLVGFLRSLLALCNVDLGES